MKVGVIRCMQTEDMCPGTMILKLYEKRNVRLRVLRERLK